VSAKIIGQMYTQDEKADQRRGVYCVLLKRLGFHNLMHQRSTKWVNERPQTCQGTAKGSALCHVA